jgi:hypothetical protein
MIGREVAHYRVTSKLGSGGMGVLYVILHDDPEFERLYPASTGEAGR